MRRPPEDAPKAKTKKARAERERSEAELLVKEGDELTEEVFNRLRRQGIDAVKVFASYTGVDLRDELDAFERGERPEPRTLSHDAVDAESGEVLAEAGQLVTESLAKKLRKGGVNKVQVFVASGRAESLLIKNTLAKDPTKSEDEALKQIYALLRPGDAPNKETAKQALERLFFSPKRYDLGRVGSLQDQSAPRAVDAGRHDGAHEGRLHRDRALPRRTARGTRQHRRHRPPRQSPHPVGR